jgi:hypothetical protein
MAQADWADISGVLSTAAVARGVTGAFTPPNGGGTFIYGFHSLDGTSIGAFGKYVDLTNFTPTGTGPSTADGGGSIRGAVKRLASTNNTGFSPFLYFAAQGSPPSVNDIGYMIGLKDTDPYTIAIAKGTLITGIQDDDTDVTILRESSAQYDMADDLWHHLRLDAVVQPNGDVLLQAYANDLSVNPVTAPVWAAISGMTDYIDDRLRINTDSAPLLGGYCGFGFAVQESINRRAAVDAVEAYRAV